MLLSILYIYIFRLDYVASDKDPSKTTLTKITAMIANFAEKLPTFKFFTAFSQLVSRICHPQPVVSLNQILFIVEYSNIRRFYLCKKKLY